MTLIKSLLLGSAAGIVAIASAQAADLPTRKGAPAAEYVRICSVTVNGAPIVGFTLPGSDTCLKISGYLSAQYTVGTTNRNIDDATGFFTRGQVNFEAASNTAMGPLYARIEVQSNYGTHFDSDTGGSATRPNNAYLTWAGITAGKHASFFDVAGGGVGGWDDLISPDHSGFPINLLAYTASFGGGFSATISLEQAYLSNVNVVASPNTLSQGTRSPDIVAQLALVQGWGDAKVAAVAHEYGSTASGIPTSTGDGWGYAVSGVVDFNIGTSAIKVAGAYGHDLVDRVGLTNVGDYNTVFGNANPGGNGGLPPMPDVAVNAAGTGLIHSNAWSALVQGKIAAGSTFTLYPEASYGQVTYSGNTAGAPEFGNVSEFVGGGTLEWTPVKNLVFDLDLLYLTGHAGAGTVTNAGFVGAAATSGHNFSGFNGKLRIERDF